MTNHVIRRLALLSALGATFRRVDGRPGAGQPADLGRLRLSDIWRPAGLLPAAGILSAACLLSTAVLFSATTAGAALPAPPATHAPPASRCRSRPGVQRRQHGVSDGAPGPDQAPRATARPLQGRFWGREADGETARCGSARAGWGNSPATYISQPIPQPSGRISDNPRARPSPLPSPHSGRIEDYALIGDCRTPRWSAATARSTGCAGRASTAPASRPWSARRTTGAGGSRRPDRRSESAASTAPGR